MKEFKELGLDREFYITFFSEEEIIQNVIFLQQESQRSSNNDNNNIHNNNINNDNNIHNINNNNNNNNTKTINNREKESRKSKRSEMESYNFDNSLPKAKRPKLSPNHENNTCVENSVSFVCYVEF
jgi:hypothetical protein